MIRIALKQAAAYLLLGSASPDVTDTLSVPLILAFGSVWQSMQHCPHSSTRFSTLVLMPER